MAVNRDKAAVRNAAPNAAMIARSVQATSNPAPRYKIDCANLTKCVDGAAYMMSCRKGGMLSNGVNDPDSKNMMMKTGIARSANCGIEFAIGASKMPSDATANR